MHRCTPGWKWRFDARPGKGPLAHIPFAVKDVIETREMATEYRLTGVQGAPGHEGRRHRHEVVRPWRGAGGQDAHGRVRVSHAAAHAQPARPLAHTRGQLEWIGRRGGREHGAARRRHADRPVRRFDLPPTAGSRDSSRPTDCCPSRGCCRWPAASTRWGSSRTARTTCWHSGGLSGAMSGTRASLHWRLVDPLPDIVEAPMADAYRHAIQRLRTTGATIHSVDLASASAQAARCPADRAVLRGREIP